MSEVLQQAAAAGEVYRAADLTIDVGSQRVTRGAEEIALPKLSFDLLLALVRAAPNLVSLEGLMREVWPNLVVSPETVSQRVKLLRDALGDDPREPRYIAGLRGRGYRMVAPVNHVASAQLEAPRELSTGPADARRRSWLPARRLIIVAPLAMLLAVATSVVIVRLRDSARDAHPSASSVTVAALPERTVAVLPFANLTSDAQNEFVALGIAEGVLHRLAAVRDLTLIARTSSFAFRDKPVDARDIGLKLNARYFVAGSVQRENDRLRVTAQLVDASSGAHVWSLRFDRTMGDIFAVEDEIAHGVARALEVTLTQSAHPFARFGIDAYLAYLQGQDLIASRTIANAERAIEPFTRAIEIAPDFAAAYAALAGAHIHLARLQTDSESSPLFAAALARAEPLLARALVIDPSLGEAYVLRADLKDVRGDAAGAEADFRKGLALSPNYGVGYGRFAEFLYEDSERFAEALAMIDKARVLDPLTPRHHYFKGLMLHFSGAIEEAEALYLQTLEVDPDFHPALARLAQMRRAHEGRFADAVKLAERAAAIDPRTEWLRWFLVQFYLELEDVAAARAVLLEKPAVRPIEWLPICLFVGELERGVELLRANPEANVQDIEAYLLRDAALKSGRRFDAREEILALRPRLDIREDLTLTATLAQLNIAMNNRREGERLAREVLSREKVVNRYLFAHPKALALAVHGQHDAALEQLRYNFDQGWRRHWWYRLEREPAFERLRGDPRFKRLLADARAHAAAQRALLDQMRERGEVPRRPASAASASVC